MSCCTTAAMANLEELWGALRGAGLEELAPSLIRHGVVSLNILSSKYEELRSAGSTAGRLRPFWPRGGLRQRARKSTPDSRRRPR